VHLFYGVWELMRATAWVVLHQVEDTKRALLLYGTSTSQVIKDALSDLHKLKGVSGSPGQVRHS
jgi:hypothetical protein